VTGFCGRCGKAETPQERMRRGGSAHAPRKASNLEWKSTNTYLNSNKVYENCYLEKVGPSFLMNIIFFRIGKGINRNKLIAYMY
jgi:hypothetical protein